MAEYEPNINAKLRRLLQKTGLDTKAEAMMARGRIDILVRFDEYKVAIECELEDGRGMALKKKEAIKDARSRLHPTPIVDVALAVVYPKGTTESISINDKIMYAVVGAADTIDETRQTRLDHTVHHKSGIRWGECSVQQLAVILRQVGTDLGDPDSIVAGLKNSLNMATDNLSDTELENAAKSLDLNVDNDYRAAAKRALLVVASAAMFHARLDGYLPKMKPEIDARNGKPYEGQWPPETLHECFESGNVSISLLDSWHMILAVDYKPIFETGRAVLKSTNSHRFSDAVKIMVGWARDAVGRVAGLRHDILGRIFHAVLGTARYDGSYYTSMPAAVLLAGLAIRNREDLPANFSDMRIIDPACGTGTLLMAAAERVRDVFGDQCDSAILIEKVLSGVDINVTALHMAATTLGLLSPVTQFKHMDIRHMRLGVVPDAKIPKSGRLAGTVSAGSLELYDTGGLDAEIGWTGRGSANVESGEKRAPHEYAHDADHVIMNPPFTRNDIRHDQLDMEAEKLVKRREVEIFKSSPAIVRKKSSGPMFVMLAERLTSQSGTISVVFPLSASTALDFAAQREFLAKKFHIETIVVPQDPKRFWFSENTNISEMLVVMRRKTPGNDGCPTSIIHLAVNPDTVTDAAMLADDIRNDRQRNDIQVVKWPQSCMSRGDWAGVQFFSPHLVKKFRMIRDGEMFPVAEIGKIADVGPSGRHINACVKMSDIPGNDAWRSIYENKSGMITSIQIEPYTYVVPKQGKEKRARMYWSKRSSLLIPERIQPNLATALAIHSSEPTVGASWTGVRARGPNPDTQTKAMAVYLNSTMGIISMLGVRIPKKLLYPYYSMKENKKRIPMPKLTDDQARAMSTIFDKVAMKKLGRWREDGDPVRMEIDCFVGNVLGQDAEDIRRMRLELSREPMVTGKRYEMS